MTISIVGHDHRKSLMIWICISYSFLLIFEYSNDNTASSFKIYSDEHDSRMYYVHMKNVCYNFKNNTILLYKSTDPELSKLTTGNSIFQYFYLWCLALFMWTFLKFQNLNQPFPVDTYYTFEEEGIWLQSIRFIHHVAHFFESLAVPFNAILKPAFFQGPVYILNSFGYCLDT